MTECVKVMVRCRPMNRREKELSTIFFIIRVPMRCKCRQSAEFNRPLQARFQR